MIRIVYARFREKNLVLGALSQYKQVIYFPFLDAAKHEVELLGGPKSYKFVLNREIPQGLLSNESL